MFSVNFMCSIGSSSLTSAVLPVPQLDIRAAGLSRLSGHTGLCRLGSHRSFESRANALLVLLNDPSPAGLTMPARCRLRSIARHVSSVAAVETGTELHPVGVIEKLGRTQGAVRVLAQLSGPELEAYERDGFVLVKGVFTPKECDDWVVYAKEQKQMQVDASKAEAKLSPRPREPGTTDPEMDMLLHPKIRDALAGCMEVDGWPSADPVAIQSMYFWQGSEQRRHQDQFYLPECMSAWCAFEDVSPRNGTVWAQAGSHKGRLLTRSDFLEGGEFHGVDYNDAVDMVFAENEAAGMIEKPIIAQKGDVLYFHGVLVHRGGKILEAGSSRHVYANHYVPSTFDGTQPDRRGAGSAAQYNNWERGGIGRLSLAEAHAAVDRPTSLSFGYTARSSATCLLRAYRNVTDVLCRVGLQRAS